MGRYGGGGGKNGGRAAERWRRRKKKTENGAHTHRETEREKKSISSLAINGWLTWIRVYSIHKIGQDLVWPGLMKRRSLDGISR